MKKTTKLYQIEQKASIFGVIWAVVGLIAGILFPMIYMVPLLFSSWALFASIGHQSWANAYLMINYSSARIYIPLFITEGVIFLTGFIIFVLGLTRLIRGKLQKEKLVTTGIYRYIRHPQNLGILLMILPFTLLLPFRTSQGYWMDPGIRLGDIVSWFLMGTFMIISSLIEEKLLIKKLGESSELYLDYRVQTGLMVPRIFKSRMKKEFILWRKVLLTLCVYAVIVLLIYSLQKILSILDIVVWSRTF